MTTATFLIGPPGAGKSTLREMIRAGCMVASSDDFIEHVAKSSGKTYDEVFKTAIDPATTHFNTQVTYAVQHGHDLIVDRTNMNVASRKKVLARIPFEWKKRAIVLMPNDSLKWKERLDGRIGKKIPHDVITRMMASYERPTQAEGFGEILEYLT